jgi:hypothetical protein
LPYNLPDTPQQGSEVYMQASQTAACQAWSSFAG